MIGSVLVSFFMYKFAIKNDLLARKINHKINLAVTNAWLQSESVKGVRNHGPPVCNLNGAYIVLKH